jgi:3-hydroxy-3-methylglutaryl CoA synthase
MTPLGSIHAYGVHIPRLRLSREVIASAMSWANPPARGPARGTRAVGNWDEDALTMAVEAARRCGTATVQDKPLQAMFFCSTTAPFVDRDDAVMVASALDLPDSVETLNLGASMRAGTSGLINALLRTTGNTLLVASDARMTRSGSPQEMTYGDASGAMLVGPAAAGSLATVVAARRVGSDFVDHYRMSGTDFDYALEERWIRDEFLSKIIPTTVAQVLSEANVPAASVRHVVMPTSPATAKRLAQACAVSAARRDERVLMHCGDAGVALPLLMLAGTLEVAEPGEFILVVGIGQGVDVILLRAESGVQTANKDLSRALADGRDEPSYVRYLSHRGLLDVDFGMRAERDQRTAHSVAFRKRSELNAFTGGRCERCGTVQFPKSRVCVNPECRKTDTQAAHRLAGSKGRVKSFTEDWQAYAARPPYVYGNVEFAEGGNLLMEFTDVDPGSIKVNDSVRFVYRIKDEDRARGFRRYFWKATAA